MQYLAIVITIVLFTGCETTSIEKAKQDVACIDKGGVYEYASIDLIRTKCKDGSYQNWDIVEGPAVVEALKVHTKAKDL